MQYHDVVHLHGKPVTPHVNALMGSRGNNADTRHQDDELERGKKIKLPFYRDFPGHNPSGNVLKVIDPLYESTALLAPDHPQDGEFLPSAVYSCSSKELIYNPHVVRVNCNLITDLNQVPKSLFTKKTRDKDGAPYSVLTYRLQVESNKSGLMKYSLEIKGKEYSAVDANY
jgi:hypothetical protein